MAGSAVKGLVLWINEAEEILADWPTCQGPDVKKKMWEKLTFLPEIANDPVNGNQ